MKLAIKLNPLSHRYCVPEYKEYEASSIGAAWAISDDDVREYKRKHHFKGFGKARKRLITEKVIAQHKCILDKADTLIYSHVYEQDGQTVVESKLNVYVPKKSKE